MIAAAVVASAAWPVDGGGWRSEIAGPQTGRTYLER
jgi:hypothetical protein